MNHDISKKLMKNLPQKTGVYFFLDKKGKVIYIGKAVNIKSRIRSHIASKAFNKAILETEKIKYQLTDSEIEALILEAKLVRKQKPKYNVMLKDDKNFFYLVATKEEYPRLFVTHQPQKEKYWKIVGPFTDGTSVKHTLSLLRRALPFRSCKTLPKKACFFYYINRCQAPCLKKIKTLEYKRATGEIISLFEGRKSLSRLIKDLDKEMRRASREQEFEKAAKFRDHVLNLKRILAHKEFLADTKEEGAERVNEFLKKLLSLKKDIFRVEGYDISNISGTLATASMVVFENGKPNKSEYRKFKIRYSGQDPSTSSGQAPNDTLMLREALTRRLHHKEWSLPDVCLIDGGKGQLNSALTAVRDAGYSKEIKVVSLAKKEEMLFTSLQKSYLIRNFPRETEMFLKYVRDEAHRFARKYHLKLRRSALTK
jgi:excinuclease ABC subunit C